MSSIHWLRAFPLLLATCLLVVVYSTSAFAGHHGHHGKGHKCPSYSDIDANGDDAVTSEEFYAFRAERMAARAEDGGKMKNAGDAPAFTDLDKDGDGNLSAEEFAAHHARCPMHQGDEE